METESSVDTSSRSSIRVSVAFQKTVVLSLQELARVYTSNNVSAAASLCVGVYRGDFRLPITHTDELVARLQEIDLSQGMKLQRISLSMLPSIYEYTQALNARTFGNHSQTLQAIINGTLSDIIDYKQRRDFMKSLESSVPKPYLGEMLSLTLPKSFHPTTPKTSA